MEGTPLLLAHIMGLSLNFVAVGVWIIRVSWTYVPLWGLAISMTLWPFLLIPYPTFGGPPPIMLKAQLLVRTFSGGWRVNHFTFYCLVHWMLPSFFFQSWFFLLYISGVFGLFFKPITDDYDSFEAVEIMHKTSSYIS